MLQILKITTAHEGSLFLSRNGERPEVRTTGNGVASSGENRQWLKTRSSKLKKPLVGLATPATDVHCLLVESLFRCKQGFTSFLFELN
jgi:hypothetical protein